MSRRASAAALVAGCVVLAGGLAFAQQAAGLRGAVQDEAVNAELPGSTVFDRIGRRDLSEDRPTGLQLDRYSPLNPGAVNDEPATSLDDPLAERPARRGGLADDPPTTGPAASRARPRTAAERRVEPVGVATPREGPRTRPRVEDDLPTGTVRAPRIDALDEERNARAMGDNARLGPIEGLDRVPEANPYAPLGIRAGSFLVTPTLEQGVGWTSNAASSPGGRPSTFSETGLRLDAVSDWSRHSAALRADATYRRSLAGAPISELEGGVDGELRLDLGHDFGALMALGYRARPESATSPVELGDVVSQPLRHTLTGRAGVTRDVSRLRLGLTGNLTRAIHDHASLADGSTLSQRDRDNTLATVALRGGYEVSPALRPFLEGEYGRRIHDLARDAGGFARSATRYALRAGVELDLREKLVGEVSAGWLTERPDDSRLAALSGLSLAGNLAWSPVRGTTVTLTGSTEVESTTTPGASGSLLYSGSLAVSRELRADLTGRALAGVEWRRYAGGGGRDLLMRGELGLTWWMNRYAGVTGRLRHERQASTLPDRDYHANSVFVGMTLQR